MQYFVKQVESLLLGDYPGEPTHTVYLEPMEPADQAKALAVRGYGSIGLHVDDVRDWPLGRIVRIAITVDRDQL